MADVLFDESKAVQQPNGGWLAPRADLRPEERCYVALNSAKRLSGFIQVFADGSAAYWQMPGEQGKLAPSLEAAFERVFVHHAGTVSILACPRCKGPYELDERDDQFAPTLPCRKCGATISNKPRS